MPHLFKSTIAHTNAYEYFSLTVDQNAVRVDYCKEVNEQLTEPLRNDALNRLAAAVRDASGHGMKNLSVEEACDTCSKAIDEFITELQDKGKLILKRKIH